MSKRTTSDAGQQYDSGDRPMDLTGAFEPVEEPRGAHAAREYDSPLGLTQAFGPIPDPEEPVVNWDTPDKWKGFDWSAPIEDDYESDQDVEEEPVQEESVEEVEQIEQDAEPKTASSGGAHARHAAKEKKPSESVRKSHKLRRTLVVVIVLLLVAAVAIALIAVRFMSESENNATQHVQQQTTTSSSAAMSVDAQDAVETARKTVDVPNLTSLIGMSKEEAVNAIGRGALETGSRDVADKDSAIKKNITISLTKEPMDSKTHQAPTVYLGLDEDGKVVEVGYSTSAASLGYVYAPFADAVLNDHIIENTFAEIGVTLPAGSVVLPANKDDYTTYASDGTTVTKERCPFVGTVDVDGTSCTWSAVLSYDYTTQMIRGDLTETVRLVYVYVTAV